MENPPKPTESNPPQATQDQAKPKKERTEAQKAATAKALAAMTAARKERAKKQIETKEKVKQAKKIVEEKIIKEDLGFVTKQDFDSMRKELMELRAMTEAHKIVKETPAPAPKERIVERIIEKAPTPVAAPTKLTGHALLDSIFFK